MYNDTHPLTCPQCGWSRAFPEHKLSQVAKKNIRCPQCDNVFKVYETVEGKLYFEVSDGYRYLAHRLKLLANDINAQTINTHGNKGSLTSILHALGLKTTGVQECCNAMQKLMYDWARVGELLEKTFGEIGEDLGRIDQQKSERLVSMIERGIHKTLRDRNRLASLYPPKRLKGAQRETIKVIDTCLKAVVELANKCNHVLDKDGTWIDEDLTVDITCEADLSPVEKELDAISTDGTTQTPRHIPVEVRRKVWKRDGGQCTICGAEDDLEFDHIIPFSKGGSNTVNNVRVLCQTCNRRKSDSMGVDRG